MVNNKESEIYEQINISDASYPPALKQIAAPPSDLHYLGNPDILSMPCVSIIGARRATDYGKWVAQSLARRLSDRGVVVVSGMAEGIDSFAHRGALEGASPTVAVMGNGLDICFPKSNAVLRSRISKNGLLLSEYEQGTHGTKYTFPARNRIISGLSLATVVVEAGLSSGSLITAGYAGEQGREVYAVPGNINRKMSVGCNKLIRDGARPLVFFDDILDDLKLRRSVSISASGGTNSPEELRKSNQLGEDEALVLACAIKHGEITIDDVAALTKISVPVVTCSVTLLEMKGYVHFDHGMIGVCVCD